MPISTQKLRREIRAMGWTTEMTNGGHIVCRHPDAAYPVYCPATPGDGFVLRKIAGQFKRSIAAKKKEPQ